MVSKLSGFQEYAGLWHNDAFPQSTTKAHVERMIHDVDRLSEALKIYANEPFVMNRKSIALGASDVFIMILALAHNVGFDLMVEAADRIRALQKQDKEN